MKSEKIREQEFKIYVQEWADTNRYIIIHEHGTIQLNLYKKENNDGISAYVFGLYVDKNFRRNGVAKSLLEKAEQIARDNGYKSVALTYYSDSTPIDIMRWYERNGYKVIGHYREDWFTLEKELIS